MRTGAVPPTTTVSRSAARTVARSALAAALVAAPLPLAGGLGATAAAAATTPASAPAGTPAPAAGTAADRSVTLITGDRVTLASDGRVSVQYTAKRARSQLLTYQRGQQTYVIPLDAMPLVKSGQLDESMFNVTQLLADGYTTAKGELPLIVSYAPDKRKSVNKALTDATHGGARVTSDLPPLRGSALRSSHRTAETFWQTITTESAGRRALRSGVAKVWLDAKVRPALDVSVPQVGAPAAWSAGYDGTGVTVGVVDSGIDDTHLDLAGKVVGARNFTSEPDTRDMVGHGTHVASTIAGTGAASGGKYRGMAPGARLLNAKACTAGQGGCDTSAVINAMGWAAQQGAKVINMSLSAPDSLGVDPLEQAVAELTDQYHVLFVIASNNHRDGEDPRVGTPGTADAALTVGAVDADNNLASFSNVGPRLGDGALKPDLTAPGVHIMAARAENTAMGDPDPQYPQYVDGSGTSMATPHVSGGAVLLAQRHPDWAPAQLKAALMASATTSSTSGPYQQGAGRLDIARGLNQRVLANPPSVSFGRPDYPHDDDPVIAKAVSYHNYGGTAVTLGLALATRDQSGNPAPAGMFGVDATTVTVPAGGDAAVTVRADTHVSAPVGTYGGYLTATAADGTRVQTPFAVELPGAEYQVTVNHVGRSGRAATNFATTLTPINGNATYTVASGTGGSASTTLNLPAGAYLVFSTIVDGDQTSVLATANFVVVGSRALTVDARKAQPVQVSVAGASGTTPITEIAAAYGRNKMGLLNTGSDQMFTAPVDDSPPVLGYTTKIERSLTDEATVGAHATSRCYHFAWYNDGELPAGVNRSYTTADLATVTNTYGGQVSGAVASVTSWPVSADGANAFGFKRPPARQLPFKQVDYYNTDDGIRWFEHFSEQAANGESLVSLQSDPVHHTPGTTLQRSWNRPVHGPSLAITNGQSYAKRIGDAIVVDVPVTGDGDGHVGSPGPQTVSTGRIKVSSPTAVLDEQAFPLANGPEVAVLPAETGTYRLETSVTRSASIALSTRVDTAWTFTSARNTTDKPVPLPLWWVSLTPPVNDANAVAAGSTVQIPFRAQVQAGASAGTLRGMKVEYSTDDGATWRTAQGLFSADGSGTVTVTHPGAAGYVSLRVHAEDTVGNAVDQTVIRAYAVASGS